HQAAEPPTITEEHFINATSGCHTFHLVVAVQSPACPLPPTPGEATSCEEHCALVLSKGTHARPLQLIIQADPREGVDASTLRIDD
ncbi:uncharacterized protein HaLaN_14930, partial [Haematococcus lacustris]